MQEAALFLERLKNHIPPGAVLGSKEERLMRQVERENRSHGTLDKRDGFHCSACNNKGYTVKLVGEEIIQVTCKCDKARRSLKYLQASGLQAVVKKYNLGAFEAREEWQHEILEGAKRYIEDIRRGSDSWFFISGVSGSGKTHICSAIAIQLLRECREVRYMMWRDDSRKLKATINDPGCPIGIYKNVDVLYVDDLFKIGRAARGEPSHPSGADITLAYEILNYRYVNRKVTIISTEYSLADIKEMDAAIAGRIRDCSGAYLFNIGTDDRRNYRFYGK